jgi:hypothetical protein
MDSTCIKIMSLDSVYRNNKFNEDHLAIQPASFCNIMEDTEKGLKFYSALNKEWRATNSYKVNRNVYTKFFDSDGKYIPRQSEILRSDKLKSIRKSLDSLNIVHFRGILGNIIIFGGDYFYQLDYDANIEKCLVNKVDFTIDKNQVIDTYDIVMNYELLVKEKQSLPYDSRGIKFLKQENYILSDENEILRLLEQ